MTIIERFAPAKINLTLHVTAQRPDGFHLLDSLVVFADVGDVVRVSRAEKSRLLVTGPMAPGVPVDAGNLVLKAAQFIGIAGDIHLEKNLPMAAGIGGGSSDAAAALFALSELSGRAIPSGVASALGADVPVCLLQHAARMSGIGETVTPIDTMPELYAVLVNPGVGVATPDVFRALKGKNNPAMPEGIPSNLNGVEFALWLGEQRNDLEEAAIGLQPVIADVLGALLRLDTPLLVRMSGSGASCFALFDSYAKAEVNAGILQSTYPKWWIRPARLN